MLWQATRVGGKRRLVAAAIGRTADSADTSVEELMKRILKYLKYESIEDTTPAPLSAEKNSQVELQPAWTT